MFSGTWIYYIPCDDLTLSIIFRPDENPYKVELHKQKRDIHHGQWILA